MSSERHYASSISELLKQNDSHHQSSYLLNYKPSTVNNPKVFLNFPANKGLLSLLQSEVKLLTRPEKDLNVPSEI